MGSARRVGDAVGHRCEPLLSEAPVLHEAGDDRARAEGLQPHRLVEAEGEVWGEGEGEGEGDGEGSGSGSDPAVQG